MLAPAHFEVAAHRELFQALLALPPGLKVEQLPGDLSHEAQLEWVKLREAADSLAGADIDAIFTATSELLLSRPEWKEIEAISDPVERQARRKDWRRRFPRAAQARSVQSSVRRGR